MMNQIVTTAIILNRTDFGEADRILTVLTPDHGRIRLMAKGVRRVKSKLAGGIELFSISHITFIKGKSEIYTLISTRLKKHFGKIVGDIDRTMLGYETLKLINKNLEDNAGQEYFDLLTNVLEGLDDKTLSLDALQVWLYAQLLNLMGHSPNLSTDSNHKKLTEDQAYQFDIDKMTFFVSTRGQYGSKHIKLLRLVFELDSPSKLKQIKGVKDTLADNLKLVRTMLHRYVRV